MGTAGCRPVDGGGGARRCASTATYGRSWPGLASAATGRTRVRAWPGCGWICATRRCNPIGSAWRQSFPAIRRRAPSWPAFSPRTRASCRPRWRIRNSLLAGRPSMGSWALYGLGAETQDLPGFVVLLSAGRGGQMQPIAARQWSAGPFPRRLQGVKLNSIGDTRPHIKNPHGMNAAVQKDSIDAINALNRAQYATLKDPEILTRVAQYEMAFRMQSSVPDLVDRSKEPRKALDMYGAHPGDGSFASNCLLARRLAERGVRFIQLYHRDWDHHSGVKANIALKAGEGDRARAALITDLKQRGMLEETLVIWGGEFGRTPMSQGGDGRDRRIEGFSFLVAGGMKAGISYGTTDELGYAAEENPVSVDDFHATMLHLLGVDHQRLAVKFQGLDVRLTGISGDVVRDIVAQVRRRSLTVAAQTGCVRSEPRASASGLDILICYFFLSLPTARVSIGVSLASRGE